MVKLLKYCYACFKINKEAKLDTVAKKHVGKSGVFSEWLIFLAINLLASAAGIAVLIYSIPDFFIGIIVFEVLYIAVVFTLLFVSTSIVFLIELLLTRLFKEEKRYFIVPAISSLFFLGCWVTDTKISWAALPLFLLSAIYFFYKNIKTIRNFKNVSAWLMLILLFISFTLVFAKPNYCKNQCLDPYKSLRQKLNMRVFLPADSLPGYNITYNDLTDLRPAANITYEYNLPIITHYPGPTMSGGGTLTNFLTILAEKGGGPIGPGKELAIGGVKVTQSCEDVSAICDYTWRKGKYRFQVYGNGLVEEDGLSTEIKTDFNQMSDLEAKIVQIIISNSSNIN